MVMRRIRGRAMAGGRPCGRNTQSVGMLKIDLGVDFDMEGQEYRSILKRVGIVLIAVGLADVAVMIY